MKRKLSRAQGMVEYALLLTMVTVPMIVIYATLGDAAGEVWQAVVDGLSDTHMFEVKEYSLAETATDFSTEETPTTDPNTATPTNTLDPSLPTATPSNTLDPSIPTDTPTETEIPTQTEIPTETEIPATATHFVPATYTFTPSPVPPTETPTDVPTEVPTPTPVYVAVTEIQSYWSGDDIVIGINVDRKNEWVLVLNTTSGASMDVKCSWYCKVSFTDTTHMGGYVSITTKEGDDINFYIPPREW